MDPVQHLIWAAAAWGGNPPKDATYLNFTRSKNDGKTVYTPHRQRRAGRWFLSISLYNAQGYYEKNKYKAYSLNILTSKKNADCSVTIQFGGNPSDAPNYLAIMPGWNYSVRLYRPRKEFLDGTWKFPEPQAAK